MNPMPVLPTGPVESTEAVQLDEEVPELVCNHDDARSMTAGTAGRVPDDIAVETEEVKTSERRLCDTLSPGIDSVETQEVKTLPPTETSERKLCDTLSPGVASVETVDLKTLHEGEASERKLCDTLSPGVASVETADLKTLHESEASERKLCDTLSPGVDFVKTEEVKSLPTSESSERKLCDTLSPGVDSVETEGLSHAHLREKTLPEDEISEEKMCDASCAVYESVQESVGETEDLSRAHSRETQERRTVWYDKRSRLRRFEAGDEVLLLLQQSGQPLVVFSKGSYTIIWSVRGSNYLVSTPDRRRGRRLCPVNMPKPYFSRDPPPLEPKVPVCIILRPAVAVCDEVDDVAACASKTWDPGGSAPTRLAVNAASVVKAGKVPMQEDREKVEPKHIAPTKKRELLFCYLYCSTLFMCYSSNHRSNLCFPICIITLYICALQPINLECTDYQTFQKLWERSQKLNRWALLCTIYSVHCFQHTSCVNRLC
ncbi:uncharacterized protein [Panulirus ornatus]|uniref:uncharacterized protein n=1 Tax=Panulirus ornatus TaxID=150431 RepID=UPI003A8BADE3